MDNLIERLEEARDSLPEGSEQRQAMVDALAEIERLQFRLMDLRDAAGAALRLLRNAVEA